MLHRNRRGNKKENHHGGAVIIPVPTDGPVDRIQKSDGTHHTATYFLHIRLIDDIDLKENAVNMMGPYDPAEFLAQLIEQLEKGR